MGFEETLGESPAEWSLQLNRIVRQDGQDTLVINEKERPGEQYWLQTGIQDCPLESKAEIAKRAELDIALGIYGHACANCPQYFQCLALDIKYKNLLESFSTQANDPKSIV